jgi:hypothetical protein
MLEENEISFKKTADRIIFKNIFHFPYEIYYLSLIVRIFCNKE